MTLRLSTGLLNKQMGVSAGILTNGTFDSDTTGWTASDSVLASIAGGQSGNALEIAESGGVNPGQAYQDISTVVGRAYKLTYYFKAGTAAEGRVLVGTTGDPDAIADSGALSDADWTQHTILFLATDTTTRITLQSTDATAGETSLFDEVVLDVLYDGFKEIMRGCKFALFTGTPPASANDSSGTSTLLCTLSDAGGSGGLNWDDADGGAVVLDSSQTAQGTAVASGTVGWFRCYESGGDPTQASETEARFDGVVSTSGGQMDINNTAIAAGAVQTLGSYTFTLPSS